MRAMPSNPNPEAVCGACVSFEPSRNDPHYGYCRLAHQLDAEHSLYAVARVVDVNHSCFMAHVEWRGGKLAFEAKRYPLKGHM